MRVSLLCLLVFLFYPFFISISNASMPVEVTISGCVKDGKLPDTETDFGTYKVKKDYKIEILDKNTNKPFVLNSFEGKQIKVKGHLLPGDRFFLVKDLVQVIGECKKNKLSLKEQQELAEQIFKKLSQTDERDLNTFIVLYNKVIEYCPDTERAQEAYWRLTNLYLSAFDEPKYDKVITLLEEAVKRYPDTQATPYYKKRLLIAYENTGKWNKAVALYEEVFKKNPELLNDPENAAVLLSYAEALHRSDNKNKAKEILKILINFGSKIEDWLLEIVKEKLEEIEKEK